MFHIRCQRRRRIPLNQFTVEDLRIIFGQGIGLPFLVPIAVEHLEQNPLAEGDYYVGDLLKAVLGIEESYWVEHEEVCQRMRAVVVAVKNMLDSLGDIDAETICEVLAKAPATLTE